MAGQGPITAIISGIPTRTKVTYDNSTDKFDMSAASIVDYLAGSVESGDLLLQTAGSPPGAGEIGGATINLEDTGGYFITKNVEAALQTLGGMATTGVIIKETIWSNPQGVVFDDALGLLQTQAVQFTGQPANNDTITVDDGTTTETFTAKTSGAVGFQFNIGADINETIVNLVNAINANSALVKADYSLVDDIDGTNYLLFLGSQAFEAKIYTWAQKSGGGNWAAGQPKYSKDASDIATEFTAMSNTDPDAMQFHAGVAQASLMTGWTYPNRGGISWGAWYYYNQDDNHWSEIVPHRQAPVQAGFALGVDTVTDPDTIYFDPSATFTGANSFSGSTLFDGAALDLDATTVGFGGTTVNVDNATVFAFKMTTGTSPFTVDSTTVVTNLNSDLLDGQHGSYYSPTTHMQTTTYGGTNWNSSGAQGVAYMGVAGTWGSSGAIAAGDLPYGSAANTLSNLAKGTSYQVLRTNSGATNIEWGAAMPKAGGTGQDWSGVAAQSLPYFSALGTMSTLGIGSNTQVLTVVAGALAWANAGTPGAHASSHEVGGGDVVTVEALDTSGALNTVPSSDGDGTLTMRSISTLLGGTTNNSTLRYNLGTTTWVENTTILGTSAGALSAESFDRTTAGAMAFAGSVATSITFGNGNANNPSFTKYGTGQFKVIINSNATAAYHVEDAAGHFWETFNTDGPSMKWGNLVDSISYLFQGPTGPFTVECPIIAEKNVTVNDGFALRLGTGGTDDTLSASGTNTLWTHNTGKLTFDNTTATFWTEFISGSNDALTGFSFQNNGLTALLNIYSNGKFQSTIPDATASAFSVTDSGDGDSWLNVDTSASKVTVGCGGTTNSQTLFPGTGDVFFGSTVKGTETTKILYLGLKRETQLGTEMYVVNNSGVAITTGDPVKITGDFQVQAFAGLTGADDIVHGIAGTDFGAGAGSYGWVMLLGGGVALALSDSVIGFTPGKLAYASAGGGLVLQSEADPLAGVMQIVGVTVDTESGGFVYVNLTAPNIIL